MMFNERMKILAKRFVAEKGVDNQLNIIQEELAELIVAISHVRRKRANSSIELMEEALDVYFVLTQLYEIMKREHGWNEDLSKFVTDSFINHKTNELDG